MSASRIDYPKCPICDGPVAGAMMTSGAIRPDGSPHVVHASGELLYYRPEAISVFCVSAACNYHQPLACLTTPVPSQSDR